MTTAIDQDLLLRYDRPGPRYTSYPTAPVWTDDFGSAEYADRLERAGRHPDGPLSLYVHIPFCRSMCWYCGCSVIISGNQDKGDAYVDDVLREARLARERMGVARPVVSHHWGGGTPTFLKPDAIRRLYRGLDELFPTAEDGEVSIEVDPRVTAPAHLEALAEVGFNRISMGVQDFDPAVQEAIHRVQSVEQTRALVEAARSLGFGSVNLDLVYGLPLQTTAGFARTLELVHEMEPDRLACYGYAHVPWLKKHQKVIDERDLPRGEDKLALYRTALSFFVGHGYEPIGMDHFARAGDDLAVAAREGGLHRNFMGYTTFPAEEMVSFGVTAISEVQGAFAQNIKDLGAWREALGRGELPVARGHGRTEDDEARRRIILDLMCEFGLLFADHGGTEAFRKRYGRELAALQPLVDDGLVMLDDDGIEASPTGRLLVRNVCMVFDAYLDREKREAGDAPAQRFSRTV